MSLVFVLLATGELSLLVSAPHRSWTNFVLAVCTGLYFGSLAGLVWDIGDHAALEDAHLHRLLKLAHGGPQPELRWLDLYASSDPVANGPIFEDPANETYVESLEIANESSMIGDHSAYVRNMDGFMSCVVTALAPLASSNLCQELAVPEPTLKQFKARRAWRSGWLVVARWLLTISGITVLVRLRHSSGEIGKTIADHTPDPAPAEPAVALAAAATGFLAVGAVTMLLNAELRPPWFFLVALPCWPLSALVGRVAGRRWLEPARQHLVERSIRERGVHQTEPQGPDAVVRPAEA